MPLVSECLVRRPGSPSDRRQECLVKRTRKFEIDGVTVTTTTSKVIYRDEESETFYDEHYFRKQELRELKLLQKQEQKQFQDLAFKNQLYKEQQEKRFDTERLTLMKNYENDLTSMIDGQKKQVNMSELV